MPGMPALSVTVKRKTLSPGVVNPVMVVVADDGEVIVAAVPLTCDHAYEAIVPEEELPLPDKVAVDTGKLIVWLGPAFASGAFDFSVIVKPFRYTYVCSGVCVITICPPEGLILVNVAMFV